MKFNKTTFGVIFFILVLLFAGYSAKIRAEENFYIGVGKTIINSHNKIGEIGYEINNWEIQASLTEAGGTKNGFQDQIDSYSISYLTKPTWGYKGVDPFLRLGINYTDDSTLIGKTNFKLGIGLNFHNVFRIEYAHHSSAGIHSTNTGVDYVILSYIMPTPWNK